MSTVPGNGRQAAQMGLCASANPHTHYSSAYYVWHADWHQAAHEAAIKARDIRTAEQYANLAADYKRRAEGADAL